MDKRSAKGFTLIELMIVISIISILTLIGGANYINSLKRSRDSRRMSDLEQVRAALEMYRTDNTGYPIDDNYDDVIAILNPASGTKYINKKPVDPQGSNGYEYNSTDGSAYELCATLEVTPAVSTCNDPANSGNYGVQNP